MASFSKDTLGGKINIDENKKSVALLDTNFNTASDTPADGFQFDDLFFDGTQRLSTLWQQPAWVSTVAEQRKNNSMINDSVTEKEFKIPNIFSLYIFTRRCPLILNVIFYRNQI